MICSTSASDLASANPDQLCRETLGWDWGKHLGETDNTYKHMHDFRRLDFVLYRYKEWDFRVTIGYKQLQTLIYNLYPGK